MLHSRHDWATAIARKKNGLAAPKIYYLHPLMAGPLSEWPRHVERCRELGFDHLGCAPLFAPGRSGDIFLTADHEAANPALHADGPADRIIGTLAQTCAAHGLKLILDVVLDRVAVDACMGKSASAWFRAVDLGEARADPRSMRARGDAAYARFEDDAAANALAAWWSERLIRLAHLGVAGFRCEAPHKVPAGAWRRIIGAVRRRSAGCRFLAWTPGLDWSQGAALAGVGFDAVFSSVAWWDGRAGWFVEANERLRRVAPVIACPEAPFGNRLAARLDPNSDVHGAYRHALRRAAATGSGLMVPMGFEFATARAMDGRHSSAEDFAEAEARHTVDLGADIRAANALVERIAALGVDGEMRSLTSPGSPTTALLRTDADDVREARTALAVLLNPDLVHERAPPVPLDPLPPAAGAGFAEPSPLEGANPVAVLAPGEVRLIQVRHTPPVRLRGKHERQHLEAALTAPRIVIDNVTPCVDAGRWAVKRVVGETVAVEADIFIDGHDVLGAELLWKAADAKEWRRLPMQPLGNDRWKAAFAPTHIGRHSFTIEAWLDEYGTLCRDIEIKRGAGVDVALETDEGRILLARTAAHHDGRSDGALAALLDRFDRARPGDRVDILLAAEARATMAAGDPRHVCAQDHPAIPLEVERPQAGFASWYEMFPRSATDDPRRHGTFDDVIRRLPAIRAMGFDVLYFPPIHPIGTTNRKGRNNSLRAEPEDLGSPYAIGGIEGGHDAIHPALGTLDDFRRLREAAIAQGLEIALDFAIQCSPDHPWLKEHPGWFRWRPDGSLRFAENPPKKYEDIVNVDFHAAAAVPDLWLALRDVVLYWADEGVRIFRVDNPHTKPLPFWEWMIADVRRRHPDAIFLSEAFTRPKMMYRLAKVGFSQSYTYFTWRNSKRELMDYLTELTTTGVGEYFRPHFFVNTPDINPPFLQASGRAGFLIRAALAATLSGLWGMYSGFELCEAAPLPGREEYLNSEKYEIRVRRFDAPGNIVAEIAALNRIRKANPSLQTHRGLSFYNAFNDNVMVYGKALPERHDMILVAVSLDPHHAQEAVFEIPLWEWGLPDHGSLAAEDLMHDHRFVWTGKLQRVRLDPAGLPFAIWRIAPLA